MTSQAVDWSADPNSVPAPYQAPNPSFFGFVPEAPRQKVNASDPFRLSTVKLWCFAPGNPNPVGAGTGVFIASDIILTVGHVIFDPSEFSPVRAGGYADFVQIESPWVGIPPAALRTQRFVAAKNWAKPHPDPNADLGVIRLNAPVPGITPIIPQSLSDAQLQHNQIRVYGFPVVSKELFAAGGHCVALQPQLVFHNADVGSGESGSPILAAVPGGAALAGLHRAGPGETPPGVPDSVSAFRLTALAINWINSIIPHL